MKSASLSLLAALGLASCAGSSGVAGPTGPLNGIWDQPTPGWEKVMRLKAVNGLLSGTIQAIGPQGPGGQQTVNGSVTGTYTGVAFVMQATFADGLSGGSYTGQLGSDGRLTGVWTQGVAPYDTASFWFVRE